MKKRILFFCFFTILLSYAQPKNTIITYGLSIQVDKNTIEKLSESQKAKIIESQNKAILIKPILIHNDSIAVFFSEEIMSLDNTIDVKIAKAFCDCINPIYTDIKNQINYFEEPDNLFSKKSNLFLTEKVNTNWVLHNEEKVINGYTCYKATQEINRKRLEKDFKKQITAWYCPDFPISIGPKGFGGLPGLIFELHDKEVSFGLTSISFEKDNKKISFPDITKTVSKEEYWNEYLKKTIEMKEEHEKRKN